MLMEEHKARARMFGHRSHDSGDSTHTIGSAPAKRDSSPLPPTQQAPADRRRPTTLPATAPREAQLSVLSAQPMARASSEPQRALKPPARPAHIRTGSIVSMATEEDLTALADILSPVVDVEPDLPTPQATSPTFSQRSSSRSSTPVYPETHSLRSRISTSAMSTVSSVSSDRSYSELSEGYYDSAVLSASPTSTSFHLPRFRQRYLSDTPSLAMSDSQYSVASAPLPTPPLSRAPSFQLGPGSPPITPSSFLPTPVDPGHPGLGVIHERGALEDEQLYSRLERALTLDDVLPAADALTQKARARTLQQTPPPPPHLARLTSAQESQLLRMPARPESPDTIVSPAPASVWSETESISSGPSSSSSQHARKGGLAKLFSKGAKGSGSTDAALEKALRADEKKMKKQQAKERRERLALQFQQQALAKAAAADGKSVGSDGSSTKRKVRHWEEEQGMYEGLTL